MGRRPSEGLAELKAELRLHLDAALASPHGIIINADPYGRVLRIAKQVKRESPRWREIAIRSGDLCEVHLARVTKPTRED